MLSIAGQTAFSTAQREDAAVSLASPTESRWGALDRVWMVVGLGGQRVGSGTGSSGVSSIRRQHGAASRAAALFQEEWSPIGI